MFNHENSSSSILIQTGKKESLRSPQVTQATASESDHFHIANVRKEGERNWYGSPTLSKSQQEFNIEGGKEQINEGLSNWKERENLLCC